MARYISAPSDQYECLEEFSWIEPISRSIKFMLFLTMVYIPLLHNTRLLH